MGDSSVVTEEPLRERPADVVTADGPEPEQVTEDDATPPAGQPAAAADDASDDADEGDDEGDDEGQDSGEDKPPRHGKRSWQKRVDRLTRRLGERDREIAERDGRIKAFEEMLDKGIARAPGSDDGKPPEPPTEPQPEDYDSVEEYAKAYSKWEREAEAPQKATPKSDPQPDQVWQPSKDSLEVRQKAHEAAVEVFEDFDERMQRVGPSITLAIAKAVEFDEDGAVILGHLADYPDELERIVAMTDESRVSKALQRFAGKVLGTPPKSTTPAGAGSDNGITVDDTPQASRQPPAVRVSRAQPVGTVLSGRRVNSELDLEGMDQDAYEAHMNRKQYGRG